MKKPGKTLPSPSLEDCSPAQLLSHLVVVLHILLPERGHGGTSVFQQTDHHSLQGDRISGGRLLTVILELRGKQVIMSIPRLTSSH